MMEQLVLETLSKHRKDKKLIWSSQHKYEWNIMSD